MSTKIYCEHCDTEIKDGEEFFEACMGQFFCKDCMKESNVTYYSVDSEPIGSEDEVNVYYNHKQLKEELEHKIKWCEDWIKIYKDDNTKAGKLILNFYKEKKRISEEQLKEYFE
jgi:hypothetical protein